MATRKGDVLFCSRGQWLAFVKLQREPLTRKEPHRNEERTPCVSEVVLLMERDGQTVRRHLMLVNVSNSGLMLKGETELEVKSEVVIEVNTDGTPFHVVGVVRHCTQTLGGYKIGIHLKFA